MRTLQTLAELLRGAGLPVQDTPVRTTPAIQLVTAKTHWQPVPLGGARVTVTRTARSATINRGRTQIELRRVGRSQILEVRSVTTADGQPAATVILHMCKGLRLADLVRERVQRLVRPPARFSSSRL